MSYRKKTFRTIFAGFSLLSALCITGGVNRVTAQTEKRQTVKSGAQRDPFVKWKPPAPSSRQLAGQVPVPSIEERITRYKAQKVVAMSAQQPAPKPTTALLLSEMQVIGIFRTPRGYAAMVEATPIKLSYVIYPGERFFNGQLVAVEEDRLVFRQETLLSNGKRDLAVVTKPLRKANAISDSMAASKTPSIGGSVAAVGDTAAAGAAAGTRDKQ
jgi:hypothetical protein